MRCLLQVADFEASKAAAPWCLLLPCSCLWLLPVLSVVRGLLDMSSGCSNVAPIVSFAAGLFIVVDLQLLAVQVLELKL